MQELNELFRVIDLMIKSCDIDFEELIKKEIDVDFFEEYENVRIVNSFLFNYSKIQDKIGAKLFRKFLYEIKEIDDINLPMRDVLNILERLEIIENVDIWDKIREIRNNLSHEYPFDYDDRIENLKLVMKYYPILKQIYFNIKNFLNKESL